MASAKKKMGDPLDDIDFDDPLAGLLSDEDDSPRPAPKAKPGSAPAATGTTSHAPAASASKPAANTAQKDAINDVLGLDSDTKRPGFERPPTRSGNNNAKTTKTKSDDSGLFDDDDLLGGLGLESPRRKTRSAGNDDHNPRGAKALLGDLLGGSSVDKHLAPSSGEKKEFVLEKRYIKSAGEARPKPKQADLFDDDLAFGSYMPSAASSRPSSRRSVRFEDDGETDSATAARPSSSSGPTGRRPGSAGASSFLEEMLNQDERDWLDMAVDEKKSERPKSAGSIEKSKPDKPTVASEPMDWLGLSQLGSPRNTMELEDEAIPKKTTSSAAATSSKQDVRDSKESKQTEADNDPGDWLQMSSSSKKSSSSKIDDWLGLKDDSKEKNDSVITSKKTSDNADYLGLGAAVEPSSLNVDTKEPNIDELLAGPTTRDATSPFPWESPQSETRRGRRSRPPSGAAASPGGDAGRTKTPLPDSDAEGDLDATLNAILQTESKPPVSRKARQDTTAAARSPSPKPVTRESSTPPPPVPSHVPATVPGSPAPMLSPAQPFVQPIQQQGMLQVQLQQQQQQQQQQALLQAQHQQQQALLQAEIQQHQERMRQQQEQLAQLNETQRQITQQQAYTLTQPSALTMDSVVSLGSGLLGENLQSQVKQLELEKLHLLSILKTIKQQHQEEIKVIEESHARKSQLIEETFEKREQRLKEENQYLSEQSAKKLKQAEQELVDLMALQSNRQQQWQVQKDEDIARLKDFNKMSMQELRQEYEESLERLKKAKDLEVDAISVTQPHSRSLQAVIDSLDGSARHLADLNTKVENKHSTVLDERETAIKTRDEQLQTLQQRLERQQHENEKERAKLQGLVSCLEQQLTEQSKELEEDKWRIRQKENTLSMKEASVEQERTRLMEQLHREKMDVERAREEMISEQKAILSQLHTERQALSDERAQFSVAQKLKTQQDQRDSIKNAKTEVQLDSTLKALTEQESRLAAKEDDLEKERQRLTQEQHSLKQQAHSLNLEKERLEEMALEVRQRSQEIQEMFEAAAKAREEKVSAMNITKKLHAENTDSLHQIKNDLQSLRAKEKQIAQERLSLAKEKHSFDAQKNSALCIACRTPVRDVAMNSPGNFIPQTSTPSDRLSPAARSLYNSLAPEFSRGLHISELSSVSAAIDMDHAVRMWSISANKDKQFLQDEGVFLHALKHTP